MSQPAPATLERAFYTVLEAYSVNQFCAAYGISRPTFYKEVKQGRLRAVKLAGTGRTKVLRSDAQTWAEKSVSLVGFLVGQNGKIEKSQ